MPALHPLVRRGSRTLLAWTCHKCGTLQTGPGELRFRTVRGRLQGPYHDLRCRRCRWTHLEQARGAK